MFTVIAQLVDRLADIVERVADGLRFLPALRFTVPFLLETLAYWGINVAGNLTVQLRDMSKVATAIATGDLNQKITVQAQGEILQIKNVINTMVDQLSAFASEVTRVAREVGT